MRKTYNEPAKALSRAKLLQFISKYFYCLGKTTKTLRVICFPGAENDGEEGLEVIEIYDQLKLPRPNIYGFEKNATRAQRLAKANLGIQVFNMNLLDFLKEYQGLPFQIVSLDFTCKKNAEIIEMIYYLVGKQLISSPGIVMVNTFGAREDQEQKYLKFHALCNRELSPENAKKILQTTSINLEELRVIVDQANQENISLQDARNAFSKELLRSFNFGRQALLLADNNWQNPDKAFHFIKAYPFASQVETQIRQKLLRKYQTFLPTIIESIHKDKMKDHLQKLFNFKDAIIANNLTEFLSIIFYQSYFATSLERYKYISSSFAPMEMDIFLISRFDDLIQLIKPMFSLRTGKDGNKIIKLSTKFDEATFKHAISQIQQSFLHNKVITVRTPLPERILLDPTDKHSFEIPESVKILPPDTLEEQFGDKEGKPMSRKKKRKFDTNNPTVKVQPKKVNAKTGQPISKDDAIRFLKAGLSSAEIAEKFTGFTKNQLAGFMSAITKGQL
jgi:hypothetical protein